ncbi:helix-turn-helix domain-containing protein [Streptomyces sp. SBT349]|uniref:helix-turn-helix domain-containing protein n=1 Tax=Streptomyces sp. SBT349 TaxID=1580539 RepID=UPI00066CECB1|nr:helix-turn-helix transcriptional regulator [Streptomyces sp. SBT349]
MSATGEDMSDLEYFGEEVMRARLARKLTQSQLGTGVGCSQGHVSRVEAGRKIPSEEFAAKCDLVLGTDGMFVRLRRRLLERGHPSWFVPFTQLERTAVEILDYAPSVITGIFQTAEYARAVFESYDPAASREDISALVKNRLQRQAILFKDRPPRLWVVLHEAALRTVVGGPRVMCEQMTKLTEVAARPMVNVQVHPFRAGAPASVEPMILLQQPDGSRLLFGDTALGGQMSEDEARGEFARQAYDRMRAESMGVRDTMRLIEQLVKEYSS